MNRLYTGSISLPTEYTSQVGVILKLSTNEQTVDRVDFLTYEIYITSW